MKAVVSASLGRFAPLARSWLCIPALLACAATAQAHFPRVEVEGGSVIQEVDRPFTLKCSYGHPFLGDRLHGPERPMVSVSSVNGTPRDLSKRLKKVGQFWTLTYTPRNSGDFVFGWRCGMFQEAQRKVMDHAKIVIHVRDDGGAQLGWDKAMGHSLEILPLTRPYAIPVGSAFRGRVVRNMRLAGKDGKARLTERPMVGGIVEAETYPLIAGRDAYLPHHRLNVKTDARGVFVVTLPRPGWWVISCATDGGPGEQGSTFVVQERAVFWVHVGQTVFDRPDPTAEFGRRIAKMRISIDVDGTLHDALVEVVKTTQLPFEMKGIEPPGGKVELKVKDRPLVEVLNAICDQSKTGWKRVGDGILVYSP